MGNNITHRISVEYIEKGKILLNHNNKLLPLLVDIDKISEFLNDETEWSTSRSISVDQLYRDFMYWLLRKHKIRSYDKDVFIEKLSKKRYIENNFVKNIKKINSVNDSTRL